MPATIPTQFRLTPDARERLKDLGQIMGTHERPLDMTTVLHRLIYDAWLQQTSTTSPTPTRTPNRRSK